MSNSLVQSDFNFSGQTSFYRGKVRDVYYNKNNESVSTSLGDIIKEQIDK